MRRKTDTVRRSAPRQWTSSEKAVYSYSSRRRFSMRESRAAGQPAEPLAFRRGGRGGSGIARRATEKT
ncbi:hypothetical protein A33K_16698 [Burkholderia humptydooensis MSMB43]|uniref:Uncharacterized protein n=1 Tax=Burkholderia humptydooensis MSMB43 TaxID=441157 RepID=A0ABN0G4N1_9BURK|nr:hypothetical protein A33K_16698 [Burkholderia humptydooensis MSMB43]